MVNEIKNGHKYTLTMNSDSLDFSGGAQIVFKLPFPQYNGVELKRIYQKVGLTSLYYLDENDNESVFTYPFTITFFVLSHTSATADIIGQYMTEQYCPDTTLSPNTTHGPINISYGDDYTVIQFTANTGYQLPSTIGVTGATYEWDSETGILKIKPLTNTTILINISILVVTLWTITATTPNSYLTNTQEYVNPNDSYTTKVVFQPGYKITNVTVTMGGVEQTNVYNPTTQIITIPSVTGDLVITVTTAEDTDNLTLFVFKNSAEKNRVDKSNYLQQIDSITGTFRAITDILNPVIDIEYVGLPDFNYVYINSLKRYYFVNDILSVSKDIWRISLSIDVLMSYVTQIKSQNAYVTRQENEYDVEIADGLRTFKNSPEYEYVEIDNDIFDVTQSGTTLDGVDKMVRFVLTVVGEN